MNQANHPRRDGFAGRHRRAAETRAAILRAAEDLFAQAGLDGARTDAIAAAAGVNKALLYYYFKSKEDIYLAVLEEHRQAFLDQALNILSQKGPAAPVLLQFVGTYFDFIGSHRHFARLFQRLMLAHGKGVEKIARRRIVPVQRALTALLRRGIRRGEFRPSDVGHTAVSVVALTVFYFTAAPIIHIVSGRDPLAEGNVRKRRREVLRFIRHALFTHPEAVAL
ncbi:MAG: TetR/AcrR family transcriptional regulator [Acidobacteriia bacterium]|nr:TetR/AcrR family transcriptional regulator [Terriglobia bacterium]